MELTKDISNKQKVLWVVTLVFLVLLVDQCSKIWIKTHLYLGESIDVLPFFKILFVENIGMAFGMELIGKLFLSLFRVVAIVAIVIFIRNIVKKAYPLGFVLCVGLVLAGAIGNLIDSMFYGMFFNASEGQVATFLNHPEGQQSYSSFLHGKVVDMFYFPFFRIHLPEGFPIWGGEDFVFFKYVFNVADSAVTVGVALILLFFRKELNTSLELSKNQDK